jgi:hypothetical protein
MATTATDPVSDYHDDSPIYKAIISDAEESLATQLREHGAGNDALFEVYQQLEGESRDTPNYQEKLVTAILAGERVKATLSHDDERSPDVLVSLADLLVRRSRWDVVARMSDLVRAILLFQDAIGCARNASTRISALQKLSSAFEKKYERTGSQQELMQAEQQLQAAAQLADSAERGILLASAACLRFKIQPDVLKCILEIPLQQLPKAPVSWSNVAHKKFRFIDARALAAGKSLRVVEFDALPRQRYVPLSYVWRGLSCEGIEPPVLGTMSIEGAVGADPISIDVLVTVGKCVVTLGCELLWIDGVCIMQNNEEDKGWQIQNMFDIYKHCINCLVLPGGLSRLTNLDEPTSWIHRAWSKCGCSFTWETSDVLCSTTRSRGTRFLHMPFRMGPRRLHPPDPLSCVYH